MANVPVKSLKHMFETGEFSDLTISTAEKDFKVHKCVLCPKSPFFMAACTRGFRETYTNRIEVEEDQSTIRDILRHLYELPAAGPPEESEPWSEQEFERQVNIWKAANKYQIADLTDPKILASKCLNFIRSPTLLVSFCSRIFSDEVPEDEEVRSCAARATLCLIDRIVSDLELWNGLYRNEQYIQKVLEAMSQ